mmetsp:Transcript_72078/g.194949  ORF Transcript_72078/g.194949 Transcript_72078/m.194949 type:complete len:93 (-) Transcript_72078:108-386(-)
MNDPAGTAVAGPRAGKKELRCSAQASRGLAPEAEEAEEGKRGRAKQREEWEQTTQSKRDSGYVTACRRHPLCFAIGRERSAIHESASHSGFR